VGMVADTVIYLSGVAPPLFLQERRPDIGIMLNVRSGTARHHLANGPWAVENGGYESATFDPEPWLRHLASLTPYLSTCLFAIAPDVLHDADATRARSLPVIPRLQALGFPVAYVAQPGCIREHVPWSEIGCLFLGGDRRWQSTPEVYRLVDQAKEKGLWVHKGQVNSWKHLRSCSGSGMDSADGTRLRFSPVAAHRDLKRWMDRLRCQTRLMEGIG